MSLTSAMASPLLEFCASTSSEPRVASANCAAAEREVGNVAVLEIVHDGRGHAQLRGQVEYLARRTAC